jgi:O-antigen/teichoic acid export membrane protein
MGVRQAVIYLVGRGSLPLEELVGAVLAAGVLTSTVGLGLCFLGFMSLTAAGQGTWCLVLAACWLPLATARSYAQGILAGRQRMGSFAHLVWVPTVVQLLLVCGFACLGALNVMTAILALVLSSALGALQAVLLVRTVAPLTVRFNWLLIRRLFALGSTYAVALFAITLNYRVAVLVMEKTSEMGDIGQLSVAFTYAEVLWQLPAAVGVVIFARSAAAADEKRNRQMATSLMRLSMLACALAGLVVGASGPWFIPLLYGSKYAPSAHLLQVLLPGAISLVVFKVLNTELAGRGKPWISLFASLPALVTNAVLSFTLIPRFHGLGAALATSGAYCVMAVAFLIAYMRFTGISLRDALCCRREDFELPVAALRRTLLRLQGTAAAERQ